MRERETASPPPLLAGESFATLGVARGRRRLEELNPAGGVEVAHIVDMTVPAAVPVPVRVYRARPDATSPVLVWVHGGGWCLGSLDTADRLCRTLAMGSGHVVVSVGYRRAPEFPYPHGLDDVTETVRWVLQNAARIGGEDSRVVLGGESAGANLALAACLRSGPELAVAHQLLVVPVVDLSPERPSMRADPDPDMPVRDLLWFGEQYSPDASAMTDPQAAALQADSLAHLAATTLVTAGLDPLHDGGIALVEALRRDGVPVRHLDYARARHGFFAKPGPLGRQAVADVVAALRLV